VVNVAGFRGKSNGLVQRGGQLRLRLHEGANVGLKEYTPQDSRSSSKRKGLPSNPSVSGAVEGIFDGCHSSTCVFSKQLTIMRRLPTD